MHYFNSTPLTSHACLSITRKQPDAVVVVVVVVVAVAVAVIVVVVVVVDATVSCSFLIKWDRSQSTDYPPTVGLQHLCAHSDGMDPASKHTTRQ